MHATCVEAFAWFSNKVICCLYPYITKSLLCVWLIFIIIEIVIIIISQWWNEHIDHKSFKSHSDECLFNSFQSSLAAERENHWLDSHKKIIKWHDKWYLNLFQHLFVDFNLVFPSNLFSFTNSVLWLPSWSTSHSIVDKTNKFDWKWSKISDKIQKWREIWR